MHVVQNTLSVHQSQGSVAQHFTAELYYNGTSKTSLFKSHKVAAISCYNGYVVRSPQCEGSCEVSLAAAIAASAHILWLFNKNKRLNYWCLELFVPCGYTHSPISMQIIQFLSLFSLSSNYNAQFLKVRHVT